MTVEKSKLAIVVVFLFFVGLELWRGRFWFREQTTRKDAVLDLSSPVITQAVGTGVLLAGGWLAELLVPGSAGMLAHWPWWAMFLTLLVADDLTQYGWHRMSHTSWLYPLHRPHHSAGYLSARVVYRNNFIYYGLMPGLWLSGALLHWGFAPVYAVYLLCKMTVIIAAHSSVPWDEPLYRNRLTAPLMWVVERLISTPSTHAAHHGLHEADGVTNYHGNYGNFLFFWDVLFGTAHITRRRPVDYGIENVAPVSLREELLLPWPRGAAPRGATTGKHAENEPASV